jgi:hypothetical protein
MSMSIGPGGRRLGAAVELDLDLGLRHGVVAEPLLGPVDVEVHPVVVGAGDPADQGRAVRARHLDQAVGVATPVPRKGQGPVGSRRGDLEGVGLLAHHVGLVEQARDLLRGLGDVVERDAAVAVDRDPQHPALAGRGQLDGLDVEPRGRQRVGDHLGKSVPGLIDAHGRPPCSAVVGAAVRQP